MQPIKCVQCGYCCTVRSCGFASYDPEKGQCSALIEDDVNLKTYKCGEYEKIITILGHEVCPAFGAGCSSSMFNDVRNEVIKLRKG